MRFERLPIFTVLGLVFGLSLACGPATELADVACPQDGTELSYENFGRDFLDRHCQRCHGASVGARNDAPLAFDFGSLEAAQTHGDRIFLRAAADNTTMPPGPDDPPEDERYQLAEWLACGAP